MIARPVAERRTRTLEGVLWMLGSGLCFVGVTGIVRHIGTDVPAPQSAFLRFAFGVLFLLPTLGPVLRQGLAPRVLGLVGLRGVFHTLAVICWFYAMARIPVAEVTAIGYLNPILVTLGAALFFGERLEPRRIGAGAVALVGAAIVLRPGLREISTGHLAQLAASVAFAGSYLLARRLLDQVRPAAIVALLSLVVTLGLLPFALWVWVPVTLAQLLWLALVAAFATSAHYCMTRAFDAAPLAVTQPVTFLQLLWATLLGAGLFGEGIDPFVLLGGGVIIAAICFITWSESIFPRQATPPVTKDT